MTDHTTDRLTPADIDTMRDRAEETVRGWAAASQIRRYRVRSVDACALGCTECDLRDAELERIDRLAAGYVGDTYDAAGPITAR
jgi:hypothetical protein